MEMCAKLVIFLTSLCWLLTVLVRLFRWFQVRPHSDIFDVLYFICGAFILTCLLVATSLMIGAITQSFGKQP